MTYSAMKVQATAYVMSARPTRVNTSPSRRRCVSSAHAAATAAITNRNGSTEMPGEKFTDGRVAA